MAKETKPQYHRCKVVPARMDRPEGRDFEQKQHTAVCRKRGEVRRDPAKGGGGHEGLLGWEGGPF